MSRTHTFGALLLLLLAAARPAYCETFVVNTTDNTTDGVCDPPPGGCTLLDAVALANQPGGGHTVSFSGLPGAGPWTIVASIRLTAGDTLIDGTTAPGYEGTPLVQIRGVNSSRDLIELTSDGNRVRGLILSQFFFAIEIAGNDNHISGNWIGLDTTGTTLDGGNSAVSVAGSRNVIGVNGDGIDDASERNVVAERVILGPLSGEVSADNVVAGNFIGTDATGAQGLGRGGVSLSAALPGAEGTRIGTNADGISDELEGNVIGGTGGNGIRISGASAIGTTIAGNRIGVDANNCALPNDAGIDVSGGGDAPIVVGGESLVEQNIIAFNDRQGIRAFGATDIIVSGNAIYRNRELAIELWPRGITPNDPLDEDDGPNGLQNSPVLDSVIGGSTTTVQGELASEPSTEFALRFFASSICGRTNNNHAEVYLGGDVVTTDAQGLASFDVEVAGVDLKRFPFVTATATHPVRGTSELSPCVTPENDVIFSEPFESIAYVCDLP